MAQSTIATLKGRTEGFEKVRKDLDNTGQSTQRLDRNTTRLGQSSASAGRQFAAQSQGLGGLVTAYAGAAANIFAISAAFLALRRAAEFEQVIAGTNALASSIGANGKDIINTVNEITKSQLSLLEAAQTVNIGLAAGFNTQQIEKLSDVSLRASKALGRSLTDAFTRVSRGAAKLEPELLDELGIFTRIDPAVKKYADSLGVSASSLTNFERRQAFVNAVIEEGQFKFRDVDTSSKTAAESLEQLSSTIINLGLQFGSFLASALAPVADFISGSLSNSIALFGLLAKTVGGSAIAVLQAGITSTTAAISSFGLTAATSLNFVSTSFRTAQKAVVEYTTAVNLPRLGNLQERESAILALQSAAAKNLQTRAEIENAVAKLQAYRATLQANLANNVYTRNTDAARTAVVSLTTSIKLLQAQLSATTLATSLATRATAGLAVGIRTLGAVVGRILGVFFTLITVVSLVQLGLDALGKAFGFEINIFDSAVDAIKKVIDRFGETERAVRAFASAHKTEMRAAAEAVAVYGEDVSESLDAAQKALSDVLDVTRILESGDILGIFTQVKELQLFRFLTDEANFTLTELNFQLEKLRKEQGPGAAAALQFLIDELLVLGRGDFLAATNISVAIERISKQSGIAAIEISRLVQGIDNIRSLSFTTSAGGGLALSFEGISVELTKVEDGIIKVRKGSFELGGALVASLDAVRDFNRDFTRGALDAEKAAQGVGRIENSILNLVKEGNNARAQAEAIERLLLDSTTELETEERDRLKTLRQQFLLVASQTPELERQLRIRLEIARVDSQRLALLEKESKIFDKVFGKPGEKIERLFAQGAISGSGERAGSALEKTLNQIDYLTQNIEKFNQLTVESLSAQAQQQILNRDFRAAEVERAKEALAIAKNRNASEDRLKILAGNVVTKRNELAEAEEQLSDQASDYLEKQALAKESTEALVLAREQVLATLEKELRKQDEITKKLELQASIAQSNFQLEAAKGREQAEKARGELLLQNIKFAEKLANLTSAVSLEESVARLRDQLVISLQTSDSERTERRNQINIQEKIAKLREKAADFDRQVALEERSERLDIIAKQIKGFSNFNDELDLILRTRIKDLAKANKLDDFEVTTFQRGDLGGLKEVGSDLDKIRTDFQNYLIRQSKAIDTIYKENMDTITQGAMNQRAALTAEADLEKKAAIQKLALAKLEASETFRIFKLTADVVNTELKNSLNEFFDAIAQGTLTLESFKEGFKSFLFNIIEGVRKAVLEETLIKPLQRGATNLLSDVFGIPGLAKRSIDEAVVSVGGTAAVNANIINADGTNPIADAAKGIGVESEGFFENLFGKMKEKARGFGDFVRQVFSGLGNSVNSLFSTIASSISSMSTGISGSFTSIFQGIGSIFKSSSALTTTINPSGLLGSAYQSGPGMFASGGLVKRFAGGGNVNYQDRVPALLQPGEFVMKKSAVDAMGANNMAMMNATGKSGGNVVVNITNEGTPQDAQASQPRFDGEKFVIDIVTRDLRNNGPIRKSLRGGAA